MGEVVKLNQKKKRSKKFRWVVAAVILVVCLGLFTSSSFFAVENIEVSGNEQLSEETILEDFHIESGMNLIYYSLTNRNADFELHPLIRTADIYVHWPDSIEVVVTEKQVMGYIAYMGMYLCIDSSGCVLDSVYERSEDTPLLTGITVDSFSLGEEVTTHDTDRFSAMLDVLLILEKYGITESVTEVSVPSVDDIHVLTKDLDISLGSQNDLDKKISVAVSVLEDTSRPSGILHVENLEEQIYIEKEN